MGSLSSGATPRHRIEQACRTLGATAFIARCLDVLAGGDEDPAFIVILGGPHAIRLLDDGLPPDQRYWLRVWAVRGLLWAGPGDDASALRVGVQDEAWRVREMTCKVVARHGVGELLDDVATLESDSVLRVRQAAARAVTRIIDSQA